MTSDTYIDSWITVGSSKNKEALHSIPSLKSLVITKSMWEICVANVTALSWFTKAPLLCRVANNKEFEEVKDKIPKDSKFLWFIYDVGLSWQLS